MQRRQQHNAAPTAQNRFVFTATLSPANEVPAAVGPETSGTGTATVTMNVTRDSAGAINAATIDFLSLMSNFPAGTIITAAHIHNGAAGVAAPVVVSTGIAQGEVTMPNGSGSLVKNGVAVSPVDLANQMINNPSGFYFNIHTATNPGGIARGQLTRTQ